MELELQTVVNCCMSAGTWTWILCKKSKWAPLFSLLTCMILKFPLHKPKYPLQNDSWQDTEAGGYMLRFLEAKAEELLESKSVSPV